jgi:O-acetyl-ADP-ribose deacetylase (regulator of RNase III)
MDIAIGPCTLRLKQGDLTKESVDAIVNAANSSLMGGGGVDGAIHRAGGPAILAECEQLVARIGRLPAGRAVVTTGGRLPAKRVIHTVGPVWSGGNRQEDATLASAYRESLALAKQEGLASVAFPSISTGAYRFPVERAAAIALGTVRDFLAAEGSPKEVTFVLFDAGTLAAYEGALRTIVAQGGQGRS